MKLRIADILSWPKRRWRTKGFGIHSPFAFTFITKVFGEKDEYYAYSRLREIAGNDFAQLALIFRCVCHFQPDTFAVVGDNCGAITETVGLADSRCIRKELPEAEMTVICHPGCRADEINSSIVIVTDIHNRANLSFWNELCRCHTSGMDFSDTKTGILCTASHLPRQSFRLAM